MESHASWEKTVNITLVLAKGMRDKTVGKPSNSGNCDLVVYILAVMNTTEGSGSTLAMTVVKGYRLSKYRHVLTPVVRVLSRALRGTCSTTG